MSPSFSQLERFVATARKGSYSAAAEDLFVTPQAVSKSIHDLESKLHVQLLEARGKQLKPTDAGGRVYRYAVDALDARGGIRDVTPAGEGGVAQLRGSLSVVVANIPLRGRVFREEDFEPFRRAYPLVELQVSFFAGSGCLAALDAGMADAALVAGKPEREDLHASWMRTMALRLLVSTRHELAAKERVAFSDLHGRKLAVPHDFRSYKEVVERRFAQEGVRPRYVALEMSEARHRAFLRDEGGALLVSHDARLCEAFPDTVMIPFKEKERIALPYYYVWREGHETALVAALRRCLCAS